jgi:hypothetical protein
MPKVSHGINQRNDKKDHHAEPHGHVEIEIADGFIKNPPGRNRAEKTRNDCIKEKKDT